MDLFFDDEYNLSCMNKIEYKNIFTKNALSDVSKYKFAIDGVLEANVSDAIKKYKVYVNGNTIVAIGSDVSKVHLVYKNTSDKLINCYCYEKLISKTAKKFIYTDLTK